MNEDKNHAPLHAPLISLVFYVSIAMTFIASVSLMRPDHIRVMLSDDVAAWVQAIGAIIAIASGFSIAHKQSKMQQDAIIKEKKALACAAYLISHEATKVLIERLGESILVNRHRSKYLLQGDRATEIIASMKEFNASNLPASMLPDFISLRSHLFAINEKTGKVLSSEDDVTDACTKEKLRNARRKELESAVRVSDAALRVFNSLSKEHSKINGLHMDIDVPCTLKAYQREISENDEKDEL